MYYILLTLRWYVINSLPQDKRYNNSIINADIYLNGKKNMHLRNMEPWYVKKYPFFHENNKKCDLICKVN